MDFQEVRGIYCGMLLITKRATVMVNITDATRRAIPANRITKENKWKYRF